MCILDAVTIEREADPLQFLPLSPQQFEILLSLVDEDRHGYGIIVDVSERTAGALKLGTGALYTAIARLVTLGLLRETDRRDATDARRRYYRLTALGRRTLEAEIARLETQLATAQRKGVRAGAKGRP
jgi:DNA-binding PadR family transcriptional regulator